MEAGSAFKALVFNAHQVTLR